MVPVIRRIERGIHRAGMKALDRAGSSNPLDEITQFRQTITDPATINDPDTDVPDDSGGEGEVQIVITDDEDDGSSDEDEGMDDFISNDDDSAGEEQDDDIVDSGNDETVAAKGKSQSK